MFLSMPTAEPLAGFKAAVIRSFSKRQESITSGGGFEYQRQASALSQEDVPGLSDQLSRFSIEDIPVIASPSPYPGRSVFPGPSETLDDKEEDEDDIDAEVGAAHVVKWVMGDACRSQGSEPEDEGEEEEQGVEEEGDTRIRHSTMTKMLRRRHRTKKEKLPKVPFTQLLKLNKPDWLFVLIGVVCSAVIGCLFPLMAILFSSVLGVCD